MQSLCLSITDNLFSREAGLTGVALLTKEGVCVYCHGTLANEGPEVYTNCITSTLSIHYIERAGLDSIASTILRQ